MNIYLEPLNSAVAIAGDSIGVIDSEGSLNYTELQFRCQRLAGALRSLGLSKGDRVAVLSNNSHRFMELYIAIPAAGYIIVPLNTRHTTSELRYILDDAGARVLFTDRNIGDLERIFEHVVQMPTDYESLINKAESWNTNEVTLSGEEIAGLFYTGGTTGKSKGVMLTHDNIIENAKYVLMSQAFDRECRFGLITPMFHSGGNIWIFPVMWTGGCCVTMPMFKAADALNLYESEKVTRTFAITTMFAMMAEEQLRKPRALENLKDIGHAGQPCPDSVLARAHQAFPNIKIWTAYGTTETTGCTTVLREDETSFLVANKTRLGTCGQPAVGGVNIRVVDENNHQVGVGKVGEITVRARNVMAGYWHKPEKTDEVLKDGWYYTGDLGYADENNYIFLVDRKKDMIVSGGENVYSTEVETVLYRHPAVLEAAVFGIPDETWGEAVHAVIVPRSPVTEEELLEYCHKHIAGYKVPKRIEIRKDPLPKSGPGKILKQELKGPFWAGRAKMVN